MKIITKVYENKIVIEDKKLQKYNNHIVEVEIKLKDDAEYWQHKYYRGYLLPAIANHIGEVPSIVHIYLKYKYLLEIVDNVEQIPKKYLTKGIYVAKARDIISMKLQCAEYIAGTIIVHDDNDIITGYIPSLATIDKGEFNDYILQCESFLIELGGGIEGKDAIETRNMMIETYNSENKVYEK